MMKAKKPKPEPVASDLVYWAIEGAGDRYPMALVTDRKFAMGVVAGLQDSHPKGGPYRVQRMLVTMWKGGK